MKAEAQRIAIAEACGWSIHQITVAGLKDIAILPPGVSLKDEGAVWSYTGIDLPDYLNDLNACHEMENTMGDPQLWDEYEQYLSIVMDYVGWSFHATAPQRCEAFLRTIGKWQE